MRLSRPLGSALIAASLAVALAALFLPLDALVGLWHQTTGSVCPLVRRVLTASASTLTASAPR